MEDGYVYGRDEVRSHWTRQWKMIDPHVEPVAFAHYPEGEVVVEVHQLVRELDGNVLVDKMIGHVFRIANGLIKRFDIRGIEARVFVPRMLQRHAVLRAPQALSHG